MHNTRCQECGEITEVGYIGICDKCINKTKDENVIFVSEVEPDIIGKVGTAWKQRREYLLSKHPEFVLTDKTTVASWVIFAPYAHPLWSYYALATISLRDVEGVEPAIIYNEEATHEIMIVALNPDNEPTVNDFLHYLSPLNYVGQWKEESDESALATTEQTVRDVVNGILNPDTDAIRQWVTRFGDHMLIKRR